MAVIELLRLTQPDKQIYSFSTKSIPVVIQIPVVEF